MAEKYVNHVNLADGSEILDLRHDTVTEDKLPVGVTAHDATGKPITGKGINADTVNGLHVVVGNTSPPSGTVNTLTFVYKKGG